MEKILKAYIALKEKVEGATAVEYGLIVALIAVVIILAVMALGGQLRTVFEYITTQLQGVVPGPS